MVSSLRKEMRLKQIYDLLVLIQEECENEKDFNSKNIAINLSTEASLLFLRGVDKNAYLSLIYFALMPAGLTNESLWKLLGNQWEEYKNLLLSKSLIFQRYNIADSNDQIMYRIESNLIKMVLKHYSHFEIWEWESKIIRYISSKLIQIYKVPNYYKTDSCSFLNIQGNICHCSKKFGEPDNSQQNYLLFNLNQGNIGILSIWEILNRAKESYLNNFIEINQTKQSPNQYSSECSWINSDEESKVSIKINELKPNQLKNHRINRKSTYLLRKEAVLQTLNDDNDDGIFHLKSGISQYELFLQLMF